MRDTAAILEQAVSHATAREPPTQVSAPLPPGDDDPAALERDLDLIAGMKLRLIAHGLRDHDLALGTDPLARLRTRVRAPARQPS